MKPKVISLYLGIFFTSLSAILFEISLTKIFSVTLWYHFAYFVVSFALFGLGAGGLVAFFLRKFFNKRFPDILRHLALLQFIIMIICIILVLSLPHGSYYRKSFLIRLIYNYVMCAVPFLLVGLILSLTIHHYSKNTPRIYFADLLGSGIGCIVFILAITVVSGPSVLIIGSLFSLVASFFFSASKYRFENRIKFVLAILSVILLYLLSTKTNIFSIKYTKTYKERNDLIYEKWSPLARITVYPKIFWLKNPDNPFGWGMSKTYKPEKPIDQLWIEQDACAGTPITRFSGNLSELQFLEYDITNFAYHIRPEFKDVFIIGSGGGRDVLSALFFKVPNITACDINSTIVNLVKKKYSEFAGNIYKRPGVDIKVGEGRNLIRSMDKNFDMIQISLIDSWSATMAGAFSLAENNLYTIEAFTDYFNRLNDAGMISISRFLFTPRNQTLRLAILAKKSLHIKGVEHPERNIVVVSTDREMGIATTLIKKTAFTNDEIESIQKIANTYEYEVLYLPGIEGDVEFDKAIATIPLNDYLKNSYYDLTPPTDNRPFFFQMIYFSKAFDIILKKDIVGQKFNYFAPYVLSVLMILSFCLVLLFYILPLILYRKIEPLPKFWGIYFILLGIGFMFVEIPLLQRGSLYLGHPTLSLSVVLFSMLIAAGCGSYWSQSIDTKKLFASIRILLIIISILIGAGIVGSNLLITHMIGFSLPIKIILFSLLVGIPAFFMGTAFPSGIRLVSKSYQSSIPWIWALNGGASVMGSIVAMVIAMSYGYLLTLILGGTCYILAFFVVSSIKNKNFT